MWNHYCEVASTTSFAANEHCSMGQEHVPAEGHPWWMRAALHPWWTASVVDACLERHREVVYQ